MTRTAYLHMGANKTGSSAIQTWITGNAALLQSAGIAVPLDFLGSTGNAPHLAAALCLPPAELPDDISGILRGFAGWLRQQDAKPGSDLLISAERFSVHAAQNRMRRCGAFLHRRGYQPCAIFYVRNQIDRINSSIAQRLKRLRTRIDLSDPMASIIPERDDWALCLSRIEAAGFTLRAGVYPPQGQTPLPAQFMALAGLLDRLPDDTDFNVTQANPSLGGLGMLLAHGVAGLTAQLTEPQRHGLSLALLDAFTGLQDAPYNGFTPDEMDQIEQQFAASNAQMTRWLDTDEMTALSVSKSRNRATSPRRIVDMTDAQAQVMATALNRLCDTVENDPLLSQALRPDAIRALLADN